LDRHQTTNDTFNYSMQEYTNINIQIQTWWLLVLLLLSSVLTSRFEPPSITFSFLRVALYAPYLHPQLSNYLPLTPILPAWTMSNTGGVLLESGTAYSSRAPGFIFVFYWVRLAHYLVFCVVFLILSVFVLCWIANLSFNFDN
jgi:hypothetical protein